ARINNFWSRLLANQISPRKMPRPRETLPLLTSLLGKGLMAEANHTNDANEDRIMSNSSDKTRFVQEQSRTQSRRRLASLLGQLLARRWLRSKRLPTSGH